MVITPEQLTLIMPKLKNPGMYCELLLKWMNHYGITTPQRISHFLAQIAHESSQLNILQENLNYSANALLKIWPARFSPDNVSDYARKPEKIANRAYALKGGNGSEESGDGWKYRGRGVIQCTLKNNYALASKDWDVDLLNNPDLLSQPDLAIRSGCWYWWKNGLNKLADANASVSQITSKINPAKLGLKEREEYYRKASSILVV
jgi:putative chitinase